MTQLTPDGKTALANTIRTLRERLLKDMQSAADSAYHLSVPLSTVQLSEERRVKRHRLEAWLSEQSRSATRGAKETIVQATERHLRTGVKLAAATFLNRLVALRQMEALGLVRPPVLTRGWSSKGYVEFRSHAPVLVSDESEGYAVLLNLVFDELAHELPGLFGRTGVGELFPIPAATLRAVVEALDDETIASAWGDDTTLGWVYQFWNDPERAELDQKVNDGGKIEAHEVAAKTQIFTERYLVEWLLQNAVGATWFAICNRNGWTPEVQSSGALERLETQRIEWRKQREMGEVPLEALMPISPGIEDRWKYWVPRELPQHPPDEVPSTLVDLKLLDPACGSGHFLVIAFGLLSALYEEEARHRGKTWTAKQISEWIVENNLHGIDLDSRAVQLAAAAIWLKMRSVSPTAEPRLMNLVASDLGLASLADDEPVLRKLKHEVYRSTGIQENVTMRIVQGLKGADFLGTLLKIEAEVEEAIRSQEAELPDDGVGIGQIDLLAPIGHFGLLKTRLLLLLQAFLQKTTASDDLGLRLRGEQLAAGVRFISLLSRPCYDLVVGNPPYLGTSSIEPSPNVSYLQRKYSLGKNDLYAMFIERSLQLTRPRGLIALLTMRNWMFIKQFTELRKSLMTEHTISLVGDLDRGAFEDVLDELVATAMLIVEHGKTTLSPVAIQPTPLSDRSRDGGRTLRKRAALLCAEGRFQYNHEPLGSIETSPLLYWWPQKSLERYINAPKLGEQTEVRAGANTGANPRFLRQPSEVKLTDVFVCRVDAGMDGLPSGNWVPYIKGASGKAWFEPLAHIIRWDRNGLQVKVNVVNRYGWAGLRWKICNSEYYFQPGIAVSSIGHRFQARAHRYRSVLDMMGQSVFPSNVNHLTCLLNNQFSADVLQSLNPTIHFQVADVKRLPLFPLESADEIFNQMATAFSEHESTREPSIEFRHPGSSCWQYAQEWAQSSVDRAEGEPLPAFEPLYHPEPASDHISYALGIAFGRFDAKGNGTLEAPPSTSLPQGVLYLSSRNPGDGLAHPAVMPVHAAWVQYGPKIATHSDLRTWLRLRFFSDVHKPMYENRPIYFPLSSKDKNFVAFVSIHRWADTTMQTLLADYLLPELASLDSEIGEVQEAKVQKAGKSRNELEDRYELLAKHRNELKQFVDHVSQCAERGAPTAEPRDPQREVDARFHMDLDDGVMINSAPLWPLLEPQWKDPRKWWSELSRAQGKKDYDWAHLTARYFPKRVDAKCQVDPSLAVAHGRFWKYHPEKAYQWELRLQDDIAADFTLDEVGSDEARAAFAREHPDRVRELHLAEDKRRSRKQVGTEETTVSHLDGEFAFEEPIEV